MHRILIKWMFWGPQCRIYENQEFHSSEVQPFLKLCAMVRWSTILLENVKFREFSKFQVEGLP